MEESCEEWIINQLGRNLNKTSRSYYQILGGKIFLLKQPHLNGLKKQLPQKRPQDVYGNIRAGRQIWKGAACWPKDLQKCHFHIGHTLENPENFRATPLTLQEYLWGAATCVSAFKAINLEVRYSNSSSRSFFFTYSYKRLHFLAFFQNL